MIYDMLQLWSSGIASAILSILVLFFSALTNGDTTKISAWDSFNTFWTSSQFSYSVEIIVFPALIDPREAEIYSNEWFTSDQNKTLQPSDSSCSTR